VKKSDHVLKSSSRGRSRGRGAGVVERGRGRGKGKGKGRGGSDGESRLYKPPGARRRDGDEEIVVERQVTEKVDAEKMLRHCEVPGHTAPISAIAMTPEGIYTASQDKKLKRWKPTPGPDGRFNLVMDQEVPLPEAVHSMICTDGWCMCGLWNGEIKAFNVDGTQTTLAGHTKKVTSMVLHKGILISASMDTQVRLWQFDPATRGFNCLNVLKDDMPGPIFNLVVLGDNLLFIGGMNGVAIMDLQTLRVNKSLPPAKSVTGFLVFEGHVIVSYQDGSLKVIAADGTSKKEVSMLQGGPVHCIAGLVPGPRVLVGHNRGQVSTISLPMFEFQTQFQAFLNNAVECVFATNHEGMFVLGSKSGALQLWQKMP